MLRRFSALIRKELSLALASPAAWVFLVIFLVLSSFCAFVASGIYASGQADLAPFFDWMPWLFMLIVPALAMPMWSEERRLGVFELTLSFPASPWEMVFGKFIAGTILLFVALLLTFSVPVTAIVLGEPDIGAILCGYAGALLLGCAYLSIASFCSAVTKSQTASFLLSVFVCGFFLFAGWPKVTELLALWIPQDIVDKIAACSFLSNCQAFQKGLIDTSELVYAVSLSLFFLALTWFTLEFAAAVPSGLFSSGILKNRASRNALGKFVLRFTWILLVCISMFIIGNTWKYRLDVSHDQAYSISPVSKQVAADLDGVVLVRFYASRSSKAMVPYLKKYADRVEWLLREFESASNGKIVLEIIDPATDPVHEEAAAIDGCTAMQDLSGERYFLGISASHGDKSQKIAYLTPLHDAQLEYEILRIVQNVSRKERPKLGIISSLPVFGTAPDLSTRFRQLQNPVMEITPPWYIISDLRKDYEVVQLPADATEIPADINAVMVIHPSGFHQRTLFALDQFVLRGGNLAVFVDPYSNYASGTKKRDINMMNHLSSDCSDLFSAWGVSYRKEYVVADMNFAYRQAQQNRYDMRPMLLSLQPAGFNKDVPETALLKSVFMPYSGLFRVNKLPESKVRSCFQQRLNLLISTEIKSAPRIGSDGNSRLIKKSILLRSVWKVPLKLLSRMGLRILPLFNRAQKSSRDQKRKVKSIFSQIPIFCLTVPVYRRSRMSPVSRYSADSMIMSL